MRVYISGPIAIGSTVENVRAAVFAGNKIQQSGHTPFIPHLNVFWQFMCGEKPHAEWLRMDLEWVEQCQAVIRLPGESVGADLEVARAQLKGIPVFNGTADFLAKSHLIR